MDFHLLCIMWTLLSLTKSVLAAQVENTKIMDAMLARVHEVGAIQGQLVNIGVILALYLHQLAKQVEQGGSYCC